jgi:hypothetical protein
MDITDGKGIVDAFLSGGLTSDILIARLRSALANSFGTGGIGLAAAADCIRTMRGSLMTKLADAAKEGNTQELIKINAVLMQLNEVIQEATADIRTLAQSTQNTAPETVDEKNLPAGFGEYHCYSGGGLHTPPTHLLDFTLLPDGTYVLAGTVGRWQYTPDRGHIEWLDGPFRGNPPAKLMGVNSSGNTIRVWNPMPMNCHNCNFR